MKRKYNVIIVGGGPAGSTAGYILSKSGLNVLIIDKSNFPRKKLCAGLLTHKCIRLLERVFGETADSLKEKGIINYESCRYEVFSRKYLVTQSAIRHPFMFVDREMYDHYFLNKAILAGADCIQGDGVKSLDVLKSAVTTMSGEKFSADFIIGADGVNSRIRRSFLVDLFGRDDWSGNIAAAHEITLSRKSVREQVTHPSLFFDYIDWGYAWIFPNRENLKIGMCGIKKKNKEDIVGAFRYFLSAIGLEDARKEKIVSYVLPYGSFLPSPVFRNIMLVGDAAGFADPLLGEGIFYAHRSAELASQAISESVKGINILDSAGRKVADRYIHLLQQNIFPELDYAQKIRKVIFSRLNTFNYFPLKIIMSMLGTRPIEAVHGIRSYKWLRLKS